jgi:hypothetical protein
MGLVERLRALDAYPKTLDEFRIKTLPGATGPQPPSRGTALMRHAGFACLSDPLTHVQFRL